MNEWQKIGACAVDSGQLILIDPCYVIVDEKDSEEYKASHKVNYSDILDAWGKHKNYIEFRLGMVVQTGWGDGYYPVYAKIRNGRIMEVKVNFDEDEDTY